MKTRSLAYIINLWMTVAIVAALAIVIVFTSLKQAKSEQANAQEQMQFAADNLMGVISQHIQNALGIVDVMGETFETVLAYDTPAITRDQAFDYMEKVTQSHPSLTAVAATWDANQFGPDAPHVGKAPGYETDGRFSPLVARISATETKRSTTISSTDNVQNTIAAAKKAKATVVFAPFYAPDLKNVIIPIARPLYKNNQYIGVVSLTAPASFVNSVTSLVQKDLLEGQTQIQILASNGTILANTENPDLVGQILSNDMEDFFAQEGVMTYTEKVQPSKNSDEWTVKIKVPESYVLRDLRKNNLTLIIIGLLVIIVVVALMTFRIRQIISPIKVMDSYLAEVANGDLSKELHIDSSNEVGMIAKSISKTVQQLTTVIDEVVSGSLSILEASTQLKETSNALSASANEQASSIEEVSSTMEQITSNIQQNADNSKQTELVSIEANKGIQDVSERSQQAEEANRKIADKITIINDIAFQTNILALNAAVEAARAGEHGKGFAVVAAEVRKLAERSKFSADEIVELAQTSLELSKVAGEVMLTSIPQITKTTQLVQEITAASNEQNNGANQVNSAIQQLNNVTQQNAASSEEVAASADHLSSQAENLKNVISFFKVK